MTQKINIPRIGLGTWNIHNDQVSEVIVEAIKIGYRHIDTARKYSNEEGVGEGIKKSGLYRKELFITTKLWITDFLRSKNAFDASLERLDLDYVDLFLIHWPFPFWSKAWVEMERIFKTGRAKNIGVSNFGIKELETIKRKYQITPAINQIEFSPFYYKKELLEYCEQNNIRVAGYSPLTRGYRLDDPKIKVVADKYQKTIPQILLAWAMQHDLVVLPKSTSVEHLQENFDAQKIIISDEDMEYLDSLNENYSALSTFWSRKK